MYIFAKKKMKVAVIGSNGQLGTEIKNVCLEQRKDLYTFYTHDDLDVTDRESVMNEMEKEKPDVVVNCSAYTDVDNAQKHEMSAMNINMNGVRNLADACNEINAVLIHISTDYVYDGKNNAPYKETDDAKPLNTYGITKLLGEHAIKVSGCKYIILRTSWLYSSHHKNFYLTMKNLMNQGKDIKVIWDQIGTPTWAQDLARAIVSIISDEKHTCEGIYHYSNEGIASWYDFACSIREYLKLNVKITPCSSEEYKTVAERPKFSVLDKTLFKKTFNQEIPYWRASLNKCIYQSKFENL